MRPLTGRPLLVKLAPNDPDIAATAVLAAGGGADGITAINTLPGLPHGARRKAPDRGGDWGNERSGAPPGRAGRGAGGGVGAVDVPVIGVGGILAGRDARAYLHAGASLVQVGTGSFADPRCAARVARDLAPSERVAQRSKLK